MSTLPAPTTAAPDETGSTGTTTSDGAATPDGTATTSTDGDASGSQPGSSGSGGADADDAVPSGGVSPSSGSPNARDNAGGVQPDITPGTADEPASALADDPAIIDLWCEQARQGAYDDLVGEATTLAITVRGSDDTRTCELPR